ncbi:hypothetical protein [Thiocapsa sp.]|uniref:hypothetical protein n=1 Tax=Thiocapsa sp. TaxID=2024551 RepID=UPI00359463E2
MTETPSNRQVPPSPDEIEVSILGPGFGECVLIHPGAGRWLIIDSCIDATTKRPVLMSALSPSDEMITRAQEEIALQYRVCKQSEQVTMLTPVQPNHISVALHLEVGGRRILLGSDLEETGDPQIGWSAVLSSVGRPDASASVFKVAHHGAQSGHSDAVWTEMVEPKPLALLTPFRWGRCRLPDANDRRRILALTDRAFITAHPERDIAPRKRTSKVEQMIARTARKRWVAAGSLGHVRWRADLLQVDDAGSIDLFGAAMLLGNVA